MSCRRGCIPSSHARPSSTHGRPDTRRSNALAVLCGASFVPCAPGSIEAVTPTGVAARFEHCSGISFAEAEIIACMASVGWMLGDNGRFPCRFASTWSSRARGAFAALVSGGTDREAT